MDFAAAGLIIRQARLTQRLSQRDLAAKANIGYSYVSKIENGSLEYAPKPAVIDTLVERLALSAVEHARLKQQYGHEQLADWCPSTVLLPDYVG